MLHLRVKPVSWFDVRLAYTETISRPRLDWMLPKWRYIGSAQLLEMGRPDLKPQLATNYDLFLSFYGGWVGLFTLGGFYKEIDDLIYLRQGRVILDAEADGIGSSNLNGSKLDRPENNPFQTIVRGLEIEWQTNFRWLPTPFNGLVLYANYAHIWSETKYPRSFFINEQVPYPLFLISTPVDTFRIGSMIDQASDIANIALGYDIGGFSARISMLYQGRTLSSVGERPEYASFIEDYLRWDLQVKQDITKNFSVYFYLNNISDRPDESFLRDSGHPTSIEYYGWTAALGLRLHN
jgi:TonB-dependent receptor